MVWLEINVLGLSAGCVLGTILIAEAHYFNVPAVSPMLGVRGASEARQIQKPPPAAGAQVLGIRARLWASRLRQVCGIPTRPHELGAACSASVINGCPPWTSTSSFPLRLEWSRGGLQESCGPA